MSKSNYEVERERARDVERDEFAFETVCLALFALWAICLGGLVLLALDLIGSALGLGCLGLSCGRGFFA